jgi:cytochrome c oxidase subunit 1
MSHAPVSTYDNDTSRFDKNLEPSYLVAKRGLASWLVTVDHKRLGVMYGVAVMFFFMIAGLLAILLRTELFTPDQDIMSAQTYNQVFTLHGAIMVFLFIIPSVPAALGNFLLPLMLGAKDVAFPKLNLLSFYVYSVASVFFIAALLNGGLDTGWTFYTPYSTSSGTAVVTATAGAFIAGFSSILTGLNFIVTVHKMRAPGMTWNRMPLFVWAIYATSSSRCWRRRCWRSRCCCSSSSATLGIGIFDPAIGGDPVLFQHFFWFYSHPAVYIMILPGMGIISELITVHSRKHIFGYKAIALSSVAIAIISFLVWGHHMFVAASRSWRRPVQLPDLPRRRSHGDQGLQLGRHALRQAASPQHADVVRAGVPVDLHDRRPDRHLPRCHLAIDVHLHDTYFVVAHFHYVMVGGTVIAF